VSPLCARACSLDGSAVFGPQGNKDPYAVAHNIIRAHIRVVNLYRTKYAAQKVRCEPVDPSKCRSITRVSYESTHTVTPRVHCRHTKTHRALTPQPFPHRRYDDRARSGSS
jgi:hypothetical protein